MVCNGCGFENEAEMRFCGMCGMPLPHRPLTTPGADSTLTFTRIPREEAVAAQESSSNEKGSSRPVVMLETPRSPLPAAPIPVQNIQPPAPEASEPLASQSSPAAPLKTPVKELVPDVPYDEYVRNFRYQPPNEAAEVTMRGDVKIPLAAPPLLRAPKPPVPNRPVDYDTAASHPARTDAAAEKSQPTFAKLQSAAPIDEIERPVPLQSEIGPEQQTTRPRFLDIDEPVREAPREVKRPATSPLVGPSFLGLSDAPEAEAEPPILEEEPPRNIRWRALIAVAVLVVIAALALLEWRSQSKQNDNGPIEVIRNKMHNLRHGAPQQNANPPVQSPGASNDVNSKPEMQVEEQPKPQNSTTLQPEQTPGGSAAAANSANANNASSPAPGQNSSPAVASESTSAIGQTVPPPSATVAPPQNLPASTQNATKPAPAQNPQPRAKRRLDASAYEPSTSRNAPGADEMMKARNASDSSAQAAWLWKATAKGNPDAPVQLANMYIKGDGVPRSCEQALVLLKTAAEKENAAARNRLASLYATGSCVQRNRVEAYRWVSAALNANPNSQWAQQNRDLLWQQMNPQERLMAQKYR